MLHPRPIAYYLPQSSVGRSILGKISKLQSMPAFGRLLRLFFPVDTVCGQYPISLLWLTPYYGMSTHRHDFVFGKVASGLPRMPRHGKTCLPPFVRRPRRINSAVFYPWRLRFDLPASVSKIDLCRIRHCQCSFQHAHDPHGRPEFDSTSDGKVGNTSQTTLLYPASRASLPSLR